MTRAEILEVKALHDKAGRDKAGLFIAEGEKLVGEIIGSSLHIQKLYSCSSTKIEGTEQITPNEMGRISALKTPTPLLAVVEKPKPNLAKVNPEKKLVLALDCVQNPGNLGTIIRLADWFGIEDIVCSADSADCFNPKVVQATMGAILRVKLHYTCLAKWLSEQKCENIYGTFLGGEDIYTANLSKSGIIVMGNEGKGVSAEVEKMVGRRLVIPPYPKNRVGSESLNVAIATAIVVAEFRRR